LRRKPGSLTVLAGGTGSAKLIRGLAEVIPQENLTVIVNVGDNIRLYGLIVCPDLDTVMYNLAGVADEKRGWGIAGDSFNAQKMLACYGLETWFNLGDRDLATHIHRTALLAGGLKLSEATRLLAEALGVKARILPASDDWIETVVHTSEGWMHFQEFWVKRKAEPKVLKVEYQGVEDSKPADGVVEAISEAEAVILSPANPITSIQPILDIPGVRKALGETEASVLAVSPIVGGSPVSGPAGRLMAGLGLKVSAYTVAERYRDFLDVFLIDRRDEALKNAIESLKIKCIPTDIIMASRRDERTLAEFIIKTLRAEGASTSA